MSISEFRLNRGLRIRWNQSIAAQRAAMAPKLEHSKNIGLGRETDLDDVFLGATPTNYRWADLELQCAFIALSLMTNGAIARELHCKSIQVP